MGGRGWNRYIFLRSSQQGVDGEWETYDDKQEDDGADPDGWAGHVDRPADVETLGHPDGRIVAIRADDAAVYQ